MSRQMNKANSKPEGLGVNDILDENQGNVAPVVTPDDTVPAQTVQTTPTVPTVEKKKYEMTDPILCRSITHGLLCMKGLKSNICYKWSDNGDVTEVEYQDLVAAIRSNASYITKPRFIIEDAEFISQFPQVDRIYKNMYSLKDLRDVLKLPVGTMKSTIASLPDGAKESIKHLASSMISNGTLDSVQKIKALDELFDTKLMLMTEMFGY